MMKATRGQSIATLVFSILKIVTGVVVFALIKVLFDAYERIVEQQSGVIAAPAIYNWWIYALPYVIPGAIGIGAGISRNAAAYGFYMAFCIISCIVSGVFFIMALVFLMAMAGVGGMECSVQGMQCVCSTGQGNAPTIIGIDDCADVGKLVHMGYGVSVMMVLGWILCLGGSIISCVSCCCGEREPARVVMMSSYPGQVTVASSTHHYATGPQYGADPQYAAGPQYPPNPEYFPSSAMEEVDEKNQYKYNRM